MGCGDRCTRVLLSGVLSYRAGRRQVRDQGVNEHLHWLRQQRQEYYVRA